MDNVTLGEVVAALVFAAIATPILLAVIFRSACRAADDELRSWDDGRKDGER